MAGPVVLGCTRPGCKLARAPSAYRPSPVAGLRRVQPCAAHKQDGQAAQMDAAKLAMFTAALSPLLLSADPASAQSALVAGKTVSLIHPFTMIFLFGASLWTGWLGLQWRCACVWHYACLTPAGLRTRTLQPACRLNAGACEHSHSAAAQPAGLCARCPMRSNSSRPSCQPRTRRATGPRLRWTARSLP